MGRSRFQFHESEYPYFISSTLLEELPLFSKPSIAKVLLEQLSYLQQQQEVQVFAYVVMSNHFHAIVQGNDLSEKLRLNKAWSARRILDTLQRDGHTRWLQQLKRKKHGHKKYRTHQVWQEGFHPIQLFSHQMILQKIEYIHYNPVKAGYVDDPADWRCSSARNYCGLPGLIDVTLYEG